MSQPNYLRGNKRLKVLHSEMDYSRYDDIKRKKQKMKDKHDVPSRFHGAFTGGFSAGYFNTVGSAEGFVPSNKKLDIADYLDEEDYVNGIGAPTVVNLSTLPSYQPVIEIEYNKETQEKLAIVTELGIKNLGFTFKDEDINNLLSIENIESYNMSDFRKYERKVKEETANSKMPNTKIPLNTKLRGYDIEDEIHYYEDDEYILSTSKGNENMNATSKKIKKSERYVDICQLLKSKSIIFDADAEVLNYKSTPEASNIWPSNSRKIPSNLSTHSRENQNPILLSLKFESQDEAAKRRISDPNKP